MWNDFIDGIAFGFQVAGFLLGIIIGLIAIGFTSYLLYHMVTML